jgi:hypothetical protein
MKAIGDQRSDISDQGSGSEEKNGPPRKLIRGANNAPEKGGPNTGETQTGDSADC